MANSPDVAVGPERVPASNPPVRKPRAHTAPSPIDDGGRSAVAWMEDGGCFPGEHDGLKQVVGHALQVARGCRWQGRLNPSNDIRVAAHAMGTGADLVSRDRHFGHVDGFAWIRVPAKP